jgi:hypothetical protein
MKFVDSNKKQLDYGEIMHAYYQNTPPDDPRIESFGVWLAVVAATFGKLNGEGSIIGNTFFYYKRGKDDNQNKAMIWAMNADTLQNMVENVAEGLTRLTNENINQIIVIYKSPAITRVVRQAFNKIKSDGDELKVTKTAKGQSVLQMTLGGAENV